MRNFWIAAGTALVLAYVAPQFFLPATPIISEASAQTMPTLAPIIKKVEASVVSISIRGPASPPQSVFDDALLRQLLGLPDVPAEQETYSAGSGVVIDGRHGLIVTNDHLVAEADQITVTLADGREATAILQGSDPDTDVAVIKIPLTDLPTVAIGDSDSLEVGDYVLAIGNPFGIGQTVTSGIVSGLRRNEMGLERYEDFIQTDAAINPGNSGGALVNLRGELVGMNAAIVGTMGGNNAGIGFAIPANMMRAIADQLITYGAVSRGDLGITFVAATPDLRRKYGLPPGDGGAVITKVTTESAARAGLKTGDYVSRLNGLAVKDARDLRNRVALLRVDDMAELTLLRAGSEFQVSVPLTEPTTTVLDGKDVGPLFEGTIFTDAPSPTGERGVEVVTVRAGSPGWNFGLREGDLITRVNQKRVMAVDEFAAAAGKATGRVLLNGKRDGKFLTLSVQTKDAPLPIKSK